MHCGDVPNYEIHFINRQLNYKEGKIILWPQIIKSYHFRLISWHTFKLQRAFVQRLLKIYPQAVEGKVEARENNLAHS